MTPERIADRFAEDGRRAFVGRHLRQLGVGACVVSFVTPDVVNELDRQLTALGKRHEFRELQA